MLLSPIKYIRKLSIPGKFYVIAGVVILFLVVEFAGFWFALNTVSSIRAYVGGEGLWSKAQKESLNDILQYSVSFNEADYDDFLSSLKIPLGDRTARLELEKPNPDLAVAQQGLLDGGNNPADIDGMIFLFQHFRQVSYLKQAISIWTQGDAQVQTQLMVGAQIHALIASGANPNDPATSSKIRLLAAVALENGRTLTPLEDQFSATLGEASRQVSNLLLYAIFALTVILGSCGLVVALFISKLVTQVDKTKSEFVALVSHQLRSPLNVMSLSVDLFKSLGPPRSTEEKEIIEGISREVWQMAALVETILNISRIELGTLTIEPQTIDVVALAKQEAGALSLVAQTKGIALRESYDPGQMIASMDPVLLQVILQNLLSNAIKYTPNGGEVSLMVALQPSQILIRVTDTGQGIPKEQRRYIFSKLFRAANANTFDAHGTGLGLYIVKSIVTQAGGTIRFVSEEGVGTTFTVVFPPSGMKAISGNARLS